MPIETTHVASSFGPLVQHRGWVRRTLPDKMKVQILDFTHSHESVRMSMTLEQHTVRSYQVGVIWLWSTCCNS